MPVLQPPASTKRGSKFPQLQNIEYSFDPSRGRTVREHWKGIDADTMAAKFGDMARAGISCSLNIAGDSATLETEDPNQQYTLDTWQIDGNVQQVDVWNHPTMAADVSADQLAKILAHLEQKDDPTTAFEDTALSGLPDVVKRFYGLVQRGTTEFENDAYAEGYVLRHTTNAPGFWNVNVADFGVGMIYTTAQLLSETQSTFFWILPLPGRLAYKISNVPVPAARSNYQWGWRKSRSSESTSALNRIDITTTYTLGQWSTDLYQLY